MLKSDIEAFLRKTPFFRLLLPLVCGILLQPLFGNQLVLFILFFVVGASGILCDFLLKNCRHIFHFRWLFGFGSFLCLFSIGLFLTSKADEKTNFDYLNQQHSYLCRIIAPPAEKPKSVACQVELLQNIDDNTSLSNKVIIYLPKDNTSLSLQASEELIINARFTSSRTLNPIEFDYASFLKKKGISATAFIAATDWEKIEGKPSFSIINYAQRCRNRLLNIYQQLGIEGEEYALLSALTLGYRDALTDELNESYAASGAMHILSVSGLHVAIIYLVINYLFSFLDRKKKTRILKTILIIVLLWQYAFITGLAPATVRASLMLSLVCLSSLFNRNSQIYNTVFLSAFIMLLYDPFYLYDVGFQLSYVAVLSIVYFQPKFSAWLIIKNKFLNACWELFTVSLAAQLGTFAIGLFYFHQFSNYFWLTNILIVPATTVIIYLAVALLLLHWMPILTTFLSFSMVILLKTVNGFVRFVHHLPFSTLQDVWLEPWQLFVLMLIIGTFTIAFFYKKYAVLVTALSLTMLLLGSNLFYHYRGIRGNKFVVAAMQKSYGISFVKHNKAYLLTGNEENEQWAMQNFRMKNRIEEVIPLDSLSRKDWYDEDGFVFFAGKRFFIVKKDFVENQTTEKPLEVDYLVLLQRAKVSIAVLTRNITPKHVIIDMTYRESERDALLAECEAAGINCFPMADKGAFVALLSSK